MTDTTGNRALAARARDLARKAEPGSLARKAAACAHVALAETRSVRAARAVLVAWDGVPEVRAAAVRLLDDLAGGA